MVQAFIADARLFVRGEDGSIREIESPFAKQKVEDAERLDARRAWKTGAGDAANPYASLVWGKQAARSQAGWFHFKDVILPDRDTLYYVLTSNVVTGLFKYDLQTSQELRLFHKAQFFEHGLDFSRQRNQFIIAVQAPDGRVNLEILDAEGKFVETVTEGDSCDALPRFSAANPNHVLFQSAGIGRTEQGVAMAHGPSCVNRLDLATHQMTEVLADDQHDYLLPRDDSQGRVYCIRRPYSLHGQRSHLNALKETLLFPVRLVTAIFHFVMAFIRLFEAGMPRAAGPQMPPPQNKYLQVLGQTIDIARIQKAARGSEDPSLVPGSWELIRLDPDGAIRVIDRSVSSYDLDPSGDVICTNGFRVNQVLANGPRLAFRHKLIQVLRAAG